MAITDEIRKFTKETFGALWTHREGRIVPEPTDVALSNDTVMFDEAAILYADLSGSTKMVDERHWWVSAEIYKVFLNAAARLIRHHEGSITAYDGDRVMGIFLGDAKRTNAARCGLSIHHAVSQIIQPALRERYSASDFVLQHTVGIDCSPIKAVRTGVRKDNDLVWVGRAANYAAKLSDISEPPYATIITQEVYDNMHDTTKFSFGGINMWKAYNWNGNVVYASPWWWAA